MQEFNWAQDKLNEITGTDQSERHKSQLEFENEMQQVAASLNREQRRKIEQLERLLAKQSERK